MASPEPLHRGAQSPASPAGREPVLRAAQEEDRALRPARGMGQAGVAGLPGLPQGLWHRNDAVQLDRGVDDVRRHSQGVCQF